MHIVESLRNTRTSYLRLARKAGPGDQRDNLRNMARGLRQLELARQRHLDEALRRDGLNNLGDL